jgi:hypothetical protein
MKKKAGLISVILRQNMRFRNSDRFGPIEIRASFD